MMKEAMNDMMLDQVSGGDITVYLPEGTPMPTNIHIFNGPKPDGDPSKWVLVDLTKKITGVDGNNVMSTIDMKNFKWPVCRGYTG